MLAGGDSLKVSGTSALAPAPEPAPEPITPLPFRPYLVPPLGPELPPAPALFPVLWPAGVALFSIWTIDIARRIITGDVVGDRTPQEALNRTAAPDRTLRMPPEHSGDLTIGDKGLLWWIEFKERFLPEKPAPKMSADPEPVAPAEPPVEPSPAAPATEISPEEQGDAKMKEADKKQDVGVDEIAAMYFEAHNLFTNALNNLLATPADQRDGQFEENVRRIARKQALAAKQSALSCAASGDLFQAAVRRVLQVEALLTAGDLLAALDALKATDNIYGRLPQPNEMEFDDAMMENFGSMEDTAGQYEQLGDIFYGKVQALWNAGVIGSQSLDDSMANARQCYEAAAALYEKVASYYAHNADPTDDGLGRLAHQKMEAARAKKDAVLKKIGK